MLKQKLQDKRETEACSHAPSAIDEGRNVIAYFHVTIAKDGDWQPSVNINCQCTPIPLDFQNIYC